MKLEGERIYLRPLEFSDLSHMIVWNRDSEIQSFVDCNLPCELTELQEWYRANVPDRCYQIYVISTIHGQIIGDLELDHICWGKREAEFRIRIGEREFWDRGYGTEAIRIALDYIMGSKKFLKIYLRVYEFNHRAIRCYLKNGFKQIGVLQRSQSNWKDIILMEVTYPRYLKTCKVQLVG